MSLITINANGTTITTSDHQFATYAMALLEDQQDQVAPSDIPPIGAEWPMQGGINGGLLRGRDGQPDYYLIFAKADASDLKWGGYGNDSEATSNWDGLVNTKALIEEGGHPAAEYAASVEADGHADFYLPSQAELMLGWVNVPELFSKTWHWSSTQYSSTTAFGTLFTDGYTGNYGKSLEFRVRAVRRFIR
ncbi:DUF1566 domain-containing protein [Pseudomonas sp. zfem005]|uniref:DUF1566 domain-containing protein n=1 Tax=Pseudomonas sp. zfem005 TaxID=3078200 RepID=UPI002929DD3B|nr:DUF1566 domain-containing protein [Pseudomonas sp. zfem005]MDU9415540.1 DUF1566 domain-containing protein [Pseudomonas sp. zfem005]